MGGIPPPYRSCGEVILLAGGFNDVAQKRPVHAEKSTHGSPPGTPL
jgi:hypothetical protein